MSAPGTEQAEPQQQPESAADKAKREQQQQEDEYSKSLPGPTPGQAGSDQDVVAGYGPRPAVE